MYAREDKMYRQRCKLVSGKGEHVTLSSVFFRIVFSFSLNNIPVMASCCIQSRFLTGRTFQPPT